MLGFKRFDTAAVTITGIELAQKIKKDQFKIGKLSGDHELLPRFGQLFSPPEIVGRLQNADRIGPRGFAPEPPNYITGSRATSTKWGQLSRTNQLIGAINGLLENSYSVFGQNQLTRSGASTWTHAVPLESVRLILRERGVLSKFDVAPITML